MPHITPVPAPPGLPERCWALLDRLGLTSGSFDFALTQNGPVFYEVNPNGQWSFLESPTGLPMASAFADLLEKGRP